MSLISHGKAVARKIELKIALKITLQIKQGNNLRSFFSVEALVGNHQELQKLINIINTEKEQKKC